MSNRNIIAETQSARVFQSFKEKPKTMLQVAKDTGIERGNICWYIRSFRKDGSIYSLWRGICPISKCRATFFTTSEQMSWEYFINRIKTAWMSLSDTETLNIFHAIKEYVLSHYNANAVHIDNEIRDVWENIKETIDKEVSR